MQGINTPGFPLFCRSPSGLQTRHKSFSVPSLNCISHSDVLPVWDSISYFHLVLSFPAWASKFVCVQVSHIFSIFELFLSAGPSLRLTSLSHCSLFCIRYYSSSLFLFISLFLALISLSLHPLFPLLDSPVPISMPFDQTPLPYPPT